MIGFIMSGLLLLFVSMKFYKNREIFKQLSKKDWLQYGAGFLFAWAVAILVIMGGANLTETIQIGWLENVLEFVIILIGLALAGFIMNKTLPDKLREFYS
ncbi:hypothetical protein [Solibacillus merdavium]|uniref:Uncharacterized protein n=1 Tax=Solibacillus merdavium TaxID=2762218 RepID=A0ABR8XMH5_9BACL|nr:hypothetical protein [Solibacillus merdavium]MBD8033132.1 hypothetical protein [Solibacillus merdavium]